MILKGISMIHMYHNLHNHNHMLLTSCQPQNSVAFKKLLYAALCPRFGQLQISSH